MASGAGTAVFGLPPVDLHEPLHDVGVPGPLSGGTHGAHAAIPGRFGEAGRYNPLSLVLVPGAVAARARAAASRLHVRVRRRRPAGCPAWSCSPG